MILMDELNDTFGEVQFNRSESAWIYQRQSCQKKFLPFYVEVIIGFCKGEPTKNCQGLQSLGLCHKINHCTGCHDTCQSIKVTTGKKGTGWRQRATTPGRTALCKALQSWAHRPDEGELRCLREDTCMWSSEDKG